MQENGQVVHAAGGIKVARPTIGLEIGTGEPDCQVRGATSQVSLGNGHGHQGLFRQHPPRQDDASAKALHQPKVDMDVCGKVAEMSDANARWQHGGTHTRHTARRSH